MKTTLDAQWTNYFRHNGFPDAYGLSAGMEGAVYALVPGSLVAKVWLNKTQPDLQLLKAFYDALNPHPDMISTPQIHEIRVVDGTSVTIERFLPGSLLQELMPDDAERADERAIEAVSTILAALRQIAPREALASLPVLDEGVSPWSTGRTWSEAVISILTRRLARFGPRLREAVNRFDEVYEAMCAFLRSRDNGPLSVIHGDLCGANVMLREDLTPSAVFDFGFLSTAGDPAFDASITSGIFNMYGPNARSIDDQVTDALARKLGYPQSLLLAYRAVYAVLTSNAYSPEGTDGHFAWCTGMLRRNDVRTAIGL